MSRILLATFGVLWATTVAIASEQKIAPAVPAKVGLRTVVIEFTVKGGDKPSGLHVVSTESLPLSEMAQAVVTAGKFSLNDPALSRISSDRYRLTVSIPVPNDEAPLPADVTPPVPRIRPCPVYPYKLAQAKITGGVVLRLSIDERANLQKVELVSASHPEFGPVAIQAVEKWIFANPAKKAGRPVAVSMLQLLSFEIEGVKAAPLPWQVTPEPHLPEYLVTTYPPTKGARP